MNIEEAKDKINLARSERTGYVFKGIFTKTPSWDQIINQINDGYNNESSNMWQYDVENLDNARYLNYGEIFKNDVILYKDKNLFLSCGIDDALKFYPEAEEPEIFFKAALQREDTGFSQLFVNFVANKDKMVMHIDQRETIFWLVKGKATWILGDPEDWNKTTKLELEAGDVIFVPYGIPHTVESNSPRAGLVLGIN